MNSEDINAYRRLANLEASEVSMALRKTLDEVERLRALADPVAAWIDRLLWLSTGVRKIETEKEPIPVFVPGATAHSGRNEINKGDLVVSCKCGFARAADKVCMECKWSDEATRFEDVYDYHEHAACLECWRRVKGDPAWSFQVQHRISHSMCCWCGADVLVVHVYREPEGGCK